MSPLRGLEPEQQAQPKWTFYDPAASQQISAFPTGRRHGAAQQSLRLAGWLILRLWLAPMAHTVFTRCFIAPPIATGRSIPTPLRCYGNALRYHAAKMG